jgi:hypothetical protein
VALRAGGRARLAARAGRGSNSAGDSLVTGRKWSCTWPGTGLKSQEVRRLCQPAAGEEL